MHIPSGILCSAIAIAMDIPRVMSLFVVMNVAIPSGMLWIIIAIIEMYPTLYRLLLLSVGTFLSINIDIKTPIDTNINDIIIEGNL